MRLLCWTCAVLLLSLPAVPRAQTIQLGDGPFGAATPRLQHVELLTTAVEVEPGKPTWVELRFRVQPGFHVNSHVPHDELLLPTSFEPAPSPLQVKQQAYPAGIPLHLAIGDGETLSTYQGEFSVRLEVLARGRDHQLAGVLSYQACDARSCFPPRKLPVQVRVTAR